ncbi:MAG: AMP-dependent synthetase/ligase [Alphaproteobacteria bacterium]
MNTKFNITSILNNATNLTDIFKFYRNNHPEKEFLFSKIEKEWLGQSFQKTNFIINKLVSFFQSVGLKKGERVFLLSSNRKEWVEFDIAIMLAGGVSVPSFVTNNVSDNQFIVKNSKPKIIILEDEKIYKQNYVFLKNFNQKRIVSINKSDNLISYKFIISKKEKTNHLPKLKSEDISTIIYTSGTSGNPKGVVLSHKALLHNLRASLDILSDFKITHERFLSFLPLSHSYERMAGLYFPMLIGGEIYFCTSLEKLLSEIKEVKPTIFSAVPRLYENIYKKIRGQMKSTDKFKSFIISIIFNGIDKNRGYLNYLIVKILIDLFLKKQIKNVFGGKVKALISGGAALSPKIGFFFNKMGLELLQGYGQTEAAPLISCNLRNQNEPSSVGFPVKNVEVKISEDNEILVKGDNVMLGYWKNSKLTKETLIDGWLYTGDLGYFDKIGRLIINGRKKDLLVTSGGDNISVQKIETKLTENIEITQAVIFGDNKPYLVGLVVVNDRISSQQVKKIINNLNKSLNSIEKIRKFIIVDKPLTYEDGYLTQTQKIKRDEVFKGFSDEINKLY